VATNISIKTTLNFSAKNAEKIRQNFQQKMLKKQSKIV